MKENLFKKILAENLEERAKKKIAVKKKRDELRSECQNKEDEINKKKKQKFESLKEMKNINESESVMDYGILASLISVVGR